MRVRSAPLGLKGGARCLVAFDHDLSPIDKGLMTTDLRRYAPATSRNREPILAVLKRYLPLQGHVLEIASGTGEHIVHFAGASGPDLIFQPSDPDPAARASIDAWVGIAGLPQRSSSDRPGCD